MTVLKLSRLSVLPGDNLPASTMLMLKMLVLTVTRSSIFSLYTLVVLMLNWAPTYRTEKYSPGRVEITTNCLAVCDHDIKLNADVTLVGQENPVLDHSPRQQVRGLIDPIGVVEDNPAEAVLLWVVPRQGDAAPLHGFVLMLHVGAVLLIDVDGPEPEQKPFLLSVHVVIEVKEDAV